MIYEVLRTKKRYYCNNKNAVKTILNDLREWLEENCGPVETFDLEQIVNFHYASSSPVYFILWDSEADMISDVLIAGDFV